MRVAAVTHDDTLDALLPVFPEAIRHGVATHDKRASLLEVVLDVGRPPHARFFDAPPQVLSQRCITQEDLASAAAAVGDFGDDNRAGIPGTLHRISCLRNRRGSIVGVTCRVGRVVLGRAIDMLGPDVVHSDRSLLFLGAPGCGKSTAIRELAHILGASQRVIIVDTSNEVGGDGDIPHGIIGCARRMQVPRQELQHEVMIEAVKNHMPEVIIVDEISTAREVAACQTIAERGVRLIATAHGKLLANLIKNPATHGLVGGISSVTLGDVEARSRGTQKTVLERTGPATFHTIVEMRRRDSYVIHDTELSVDALLAGKVPKVRRMQREPGGDMSHQLVPYDAAARRK